MLNFGMPFLLETKSVEQAIAIAERLNLDFVELNSNFPNSQAQKLPLSTLQAAQNELGIHYTFHLDDSMSIADFNPYVRKAYLETTLEAIELASQLDMPTINIHFAEGNIVTLPDGRHYLFDYYREEFYANLREYRDAVEAAIGKKPIRISVENTFGWAENARKGIEVLLESPVFGLCLDVGHNCLVNYGDSDFFEKNRSRLIHVHLHDCLGRKDHQALGTGDIDLAKWLGLAKECGASVLIETKTIAALEESVAWLRAHDLKE
ncbi:MAG: sugar phosphate isomerase/epimerase [Clostridiales bacterium]|nr:sugar phosphate isomerase/epimerase [Clostridiales bacterium]